MSAKAKSWFAEMGSEQIGKVGYRQGFVFIGKAGGGLKVHEKRAESVKDSVSIT